MTSLIQFLSNLRSLGVLLSLDGDRLICNAPKGAITPEIKKELADRKPEIRAFLSESASMHSSANEDRSLIDLPLSHAQQRLWFLAQLDPANPVYNVVIALRLTGELDRSALEKSLRTLVDRHESLRTAFYERNGKPLARVIEGSNWKSEYIDLSSLPRKESEDQASQLIHVEARKPFPLEHAPLFRATLIHVAEDCHLLLLVLHHIVSDGWSLGILAKELGSLYSAFLTNQNPLLPEIVVQYRDFVRFEQEAGEETAARQLPFWMDRLSGTLPVLELPGDRRRSSTQTFAGKRIAIEIDSSLARQLQELCRDSGSTPFMLLLAAFKAIVSRYTGLEDILIGSGTSNRQRQEFALLVGFFVNNLVMRTDLSGNLSFRDLLAKVKDTALSAYAHQDVPFGLLVEKLQPERSLSQSPLIQVVFTLQNVPMQEVLLPKLKVEVEPVDPGIARADVSVEVWPNGEGYRCDFEYNTDIFDEATIRAMQSHYISFLRQAVADPSFRVKEIPFLSKEERHRILVEWNDTSLEYPAIPVHEVFESYADVTPDAPALRSESGELSYHELNRIANAIAHYLCALDLPPHSFVAVCGDGNPLGMAAFLGILKAGHAYLPVDDTSPLERLRLLLADAGTTVLIAARTLHDLFGELGIPHLVAPEDLIVKATDQSPNIPVQIDDPAYLMFTSGSTGTPKGVVIPHRGVVRLVKNNNFLSWKSGGVFLQLAPLSFDASTLEIWGALLNGGTLVPSSSDQREPETIRTAIRENGVTSLCLTAALFHFMVDENLETFRPLHQLLIGGGVLSPSHIDRLLRHLPGLSLINGYGPTENTTLTCCYTFDKSMLDGGAIPIGKPIRNARIFILDEFQQPVPIGVAGELYASGDGLALHYLNAPAQTAESFVELRFEELGAVRAYRTGDIARYRSDGVVEFLGRKDNQIKLRGYRVELAEVEQALLGVSGVRATVVSVRKSQDGDQRLVAYVVPTVGSRLDALELRTALRKVLPPYEIPGSFLFVPEVPRTTNDKVDYAALDALPLDPVGDKQNLRQPSNEIESKLASIFAELLKLETVSVSDDFFALGGHSLLVKQLISRVSSTFHVKLPVADIFRNSTVESLARDIESAIALSPAGPPAVAAKTDHLLSRSQQRLWFLNQLDSGNPVYNIAITLRLDGSLRRDALEETFRVIVRRHESLHTVFRQREGSPYALVEDGQNWQMQYMDLSSHPAELRTTQAISLAEEEMQRPFALDRDSLFRVMLIKISSEEHIIVLVMHHIISDGWSVGVLSQELSVIYSSLVRRGAVPLLQPCSQFRDFVAWEQERSTSSSDADLQYWQHQLGGELPQLELATDFPRPPRPSLRGNREAIEIPFDLANKLQKVARERNATLFMILLAGFNVLLRQYSGQDDILVGTPTAGRSKTDFEGIIGFFVNNLVLRTNLSGNPGFVELLERVQKTSLAAFEHEGTPFDQLVEVLQPERRLDRSPIFQVMFALQNAPLPLMSLDDLQVIPFEVQSLRARYDLAVDIYFVDGNYRCFFEYNADLFEEGTVRHMQEQYIRLLEAVASDPTKHIGELSTLSEADRHRILEDWNHTEMAPSPYATVPAWFQAQAAKSPDATAIEMGEKTLSYHELDAQSTRLAQRLRARGAGRGVIVGFYLDRSPQMVVAMLGILKAGAAYLPLDPALPEERIRFLISDSAVPLIVTQGAVRNFLPESSPALLMVDDIDEPTEQVVSEEPTAEDVAYIIYTSGSTGSPKGTEISHASLVNLLASMSLEPGLSSADTLVAITTISFDIAALEIFGPLVCGARLVLASRDQVIDPDSLGSLIEFSGATVMQATPSTWRNLVESGWMGHANLRMWCGGEALSVNLAEQLLGRGRELWNLYGPTETTIWSAAHRVRSGENPILIGRPIGNTRMYILDSELQPLPVGVPGELYIAGAGVARGYLRRPELTGARFLADQFNNRFGGRMYRTGDLARYRIDGQIQLIGRTDNQIKLRGHRIELEEIERMLERHVDVLQAVVAVHEQDADRQLIAYIKPASDQVDIGCLRPWLLEQLPEYMIPSAFYTIQEIPLTPNGKVDRKRLQRPKVLPREDLRGVIDPRNRIEEQLAEVWSKILDVDRVSVRENFFDLGGHSLLLIRVRERLRQDLDIDVSVVDLFRYPTIESLAASLERRAQGVPMALGAVSNG